MALRLEIISRHRQGLGERGVKEFGVDGGTIGRSLESDWVLPDAQRYVSSRHASIDFRSGSYYIVDTSTNGVYVNDADQPVGRGKPQRLFNGDRLRMGEYLIRVHIDDEDEVDGDLSTGPHVDPVDRAQRVDPPDPTTSDLVDAYEITGVGIEELLSDDAEAAAFKKAAEQRAAALKLEDDPAARSGAARSRVTEPKPEAARAPQPARLEAQAPAPASPGSRPSASLDAFFRGAGMPARAMSEKDIEFLLHRLGQIMRELIVGITESLHLRSEQKNTLRLPQTTIQPHSNNPLKFSAGVDEALNNLLFRDASEYLPAIDAVREAFRDIRTHQQALLAAMTTALIDYMGRLDPEELEQKFARGSKRNALMGAANRLKYWDLYKDLYQVMTQHSPGQFPQAFVEDLCRSYEEEIERCGVSPVQERVKARAG